MYIMAGSKKWTIATARQHLPALIGSAAREPQRVYRRDKLVAAVVSPELAAELDAAQPRPTLAETFEELRRLCDAEDYELTVPARRDRPDPTTPKRRRR